jgi:hypothetical protein
MKSQFGKCENEVLKFWPQTLYYQARFWSCRHITKNLSSQFFDLDIENPLGGGTLAKIESTLHSAGYSPAFRRVQPNSGLLISSC